MGQYFNIFGYMPLNILRKENDQKFIEIASGEHFKEKIDMKVTC